VGDEREKKETKKVRKKKRKKKGQLNPKPKVLSHLSSTQFFLCVCVYGRRNEIGKRKGKKETEERQ